MWIQVRSIDGMTKIKLDGLSKLTKIEDVQERLVEDFEAPVDRQRLFYRGKQVVYQIVISSMYRLARALLMHIHTNLL